MERTILLLSKEELTPEQMEELKYRYEIYRCIALPKELMRLWTNINPMGEFNDKYFRPIKQYIMGLKASGLQYCLVHGENSAVFYIVSFLLSQGMTPLYSTTYQVYARGERESVLAPRQHIFFRKYVPYIA